MGLEPVSLRSRVAGSIDGASQAPLTSMTLTQIMKCVSKIYLALFIYLAFFVYLDCLLLMTE